MMFVFKDGTSASLAQKGNTLCSPFSFQYSHAAFTMSLISRSKVR